MTVVPVLHHTQSTNAGYPPQREKKVAGTLDTAGPFLFLSVRSQTPPAAPLLPLVVFVAIPRPPLLLLARWLLAHFIHRAFVAVVGVHGPRLKFVYIPPRRRLPSPG